MIVVSDTSPLTALLTVGEAELLLNFSPRWSSRRAVRDELMRSHSTLPPWLRVEAVRNSDEALRMAEVVNAGRPRPLNWQKNFVPIAC